MPNAEAAKAQPPKHRRSFSGIRTGFGLSSSPSLPVIGSNSNQSALDIATPSRPSTSEGDKMRNASHGGRAGMAVGSHSNLNLSSSSGSLLPGIRSLRSKFSFGTSSIAPTTPARSVSNGSISINASSGGFMAKLPFGSLSRNNSKQKVFTLPSSSTELVSPFATFQNGKDEETSPVMHISAFPPSPGSILSDHSGANVSPSLPPAQSTPYYPETLGKGIPRSPTLPSPSSLSETKIAGSQKALLTPLVHEDISPSPSGRSLHSLQGVVERRPSKLTIEQSRISEVTEPDSSVDFGVGSRPSSKHVLPSSPLRSSSTSPIDELSSEGQISRELFEKHSGDSLTNLTIPPIPKSGSVLALDQNVPQLSSPLPGSESSADNGTERHDDSSGTHSEDEDFVSAPPSARTSVDQPAIGPDLDALPSPHRFAVHSGAEKRGPRASLQAYTSTRGTITPIISSTPLKRDGNKRVSRQSIKPLESWKDVHPTSSPSPPESPTRGDNVQRRSADGRESVSPTRSAFSSSINPSDTRLSPSPSPFGHRRRQSVTQMAVPVIRPSLARSIAGSGKPPVAGTRKDYGALSTTRARYSNGAAPTGSLDRYGSPEPPRPSSRTSPRTIGPRTDGENFLPPRSYSSLSATTRSRPRRATADEVFGSSSGSRTTRCSPSEDSQDGAEFPMRHSSELRRSKWKDDSPRSATACIRPDTIRPGSARGELSTDRLGPSTMRAFEEAGLVDPRDRSVISLPEYVRRPHTAMAESPLDRPLYGGRRSSDGRRSGESYYQTPIRSSIETARPDSVSGFTSSSNDHMSHDRNGSSSGFHSSSPVSSGRTVYSTSGNNPYAAMHDRYELEKEALLMALGESKRKSNVLQDENETLRTRNRELHAYAMELERKLANLERIVTERASQDSTYSTRVIRRRAPITVSPQLTDHSPSNSHLLEPPVSRWLATTPTPKARSPSPPLTVTVKKSPHPDESASLVVPTPSLPASPSPAPQSRHRHTNSDASSILPHISATMSMLLNEKGPSNEDMTTSFRDDGLLSNACDDDAIQRFKNALLGASTATARQSTSTRHDGSPTKSTKTVPRPATSPTESSFALTSAPASPGSMVLRTEDEIHLDDLMSFRDEFDG